MHLSTLLYQADDITTFRARPSDLESIAAWQADLNTRLPPGSSYTVEIGHNGNGNIEFSVLNDTAGICNPENWIVYNAPPVPPLEFQKPLGTGTSFWPSTPSTFIWSKECMALDELGAWFMVPANRDKFTHISHTFNHENLDNATFSDTNDELMFNIAWLAQIGISAGKFSSNGLIPPAITGLHNGDAIQAFLANGLKYVVGDTSRPLLMNQVCPPVPLSCLCQTQTGK